MSQGTMQSSDAVDASTTAISRVLALRGLVTERAAEPTDSSVLVSQRMRATRACMRSQTVALCRGCRVQGRRASRWRPMAEQKIQNRVKVPSTSKVRKCTSVPRAHGFLPHPSSQLHLCSSLLRLLLHHIAHAHSQRASPRSRRPSMGKHYCDYCDVFLTHDSVSVRKAHNSGRNHLQNVREYYQTLDPEQIQQVIDTLAHEYDRRGIEKPRDLLQPAGSSFMTFGAGPLSGASDRGKLHAGLNCVPTALLTERSSTLSSLATAFGSQGPPRMSMGGSGGGGSNGTGPPRGGYGSGPGGYSRYNGNNAPSRDQGPPPNYNRPPPQGGPYSRPPPNMMGGANAPPGGNGAYPPRGPPPGYGAPPSNMFPSGPPPNMRGPPPSLPPNPSYPPPQSRSTYGPR